MNAKTTTHPNISQNIEMTEDTRASTSSSSSPSSPSTSTLMSNIVSFFTPNKTKSIAPTKPPPPPPPRPPKSTRTTATAKSRSSWLPTLLTTYAPPKTTSPKKSNNHDNINNSSSKPAIWQWSDRTGWTNYSTTHCAMIENKFQNQKSQSFQMKINNTQYTIDLLRNVQINAVSQRRRRIRRYDPKNPMNNAISTYHAQWQSLFQHKNNNSQQQQQQPHTKDALRVKWQWLNDNSFWIDFSKSVSQQIERARKNNGDTTIVNIQNTQYEINIVKLCQKNLQTGKIRSIRVVPNTVPSQKPNLTSSKKSSRSGSKNSDKRWTGPRRKTFSNKIMKLYHVTNKTCADAIKEDYKLKRGSQGMFGGGIYFAETPSVAKNKAYRDVYLITCLVLVGEEHKVMDCNGGKFTFQQLQKMKKDSVWAPNGCGTGECERVVYNWDQVKVIDVNPYESYQVISTRYIKLLSIQQ